MPILGEINTDTVVITSTYVIKDKLPILFVTCDDDDEGGFNLQFHCNNGDYSMETMLLVSLETIMKIDEELKLLNLDIGDEFVRSDVNSPWNKVKI